jgi:hypothetical protein
MTRFHLHFILIGKGVLVMLQNGSGGKHSNPSGTPDHVWQESGAYFVGWAASLSVLPVFDCIRDYRVSVKLHGS